MAPMNLRGLLFGWKFLALNAFRKRIWRLAPTAVVLGDLVGEE